MDISNVLWYNTKDSLKDKAEILLKRSIASTISIKKLGFIA